MPTVASQPSLRSTQAVGAILLHQFARERFLEAGIDENLIQEAESQEDVEHLADSLLQDDIDEESNTNTSKTSTSNSTFVNLGGTDNNQNGTNNNSQMDDQYQSVFAEVSMDSRINRSETTDADSTLTNEISADHSSMSQRKNYSSNGTFEANDRYQSVIDSSSNSHGNTVWHSINASRSNPSKLDRLQSLPLMASYGRELRKLADEFERSRYRKTVKAKAEEVNLTDITKEAFVSLLEELFKGGVTRSRIVSLFFFCTDVALRATSFASELVVRLLGWSFSYIINTVCKIVHEFGGWDLLYRKLPTLLYNGCINGYEFLGSGFFLGVGSCLGIFAILAVCLHKSSRASA